MPAYMPRARESASSDMTCLPGIGLQFLHLCSGALGSTISGRLDEARPILRLRLAFGPRHGRRVRGVRRLIDEDACLGRGSRDGRGKICRFDAEGLGEDKESVVKRSADVSDDLVDVGPWWELPAYDRPFHQGADQYRAAQPETLP